jgi:EmrB/QacA subfamily drug resistance transporter
MQSSRRWWALVALALATFMTYLDNNIVKVALPTIQRSLGLSISGLEWIVSGYILVFAGLMLAGGRIADVYGRRGVFLGGLAVFTVASLLAGLSGDQTMLIASRVLQGAGAALLTPTSLSLLPATFPDPRERNLAVGVWSAVGALALALGPVTGGFISENWDWGWIYLINVPIGVITLAIGAWALTPSKGTRRRLDVPGVVTSAIMLFALTYALIEGERRGWTSGVILGAFGLAVAALVAFIVIEARSADPMVDVSLFRSRVFSGGALSMGVWAFGVFGIYFFTALYLQNVLGFTPLEAGAAFVPMALVMAVVATVSGPLASRVGTSRVVALGLTLMAGAVLGVSSVGAQGDLGDLMPWFLLYGLGGGMLVPLTAAIITMLPRNREGVASGVLNVSREVFGLLGVTVLGAILSTRQSGAIADGLRPLDAFLRGYQTALVIAAVVIAVGVPISLFSLRKARGGEPEAKAAAPEPVPMAPESVG